MKKSLAKKKRIASIRKFLSQVVAKSFIFSLGNNKFIIPEIQFACSGASKFCSTSRKEKFSDDWIAFGIDESIRIESRI